MVMLKVALLLVASLANILAAFVVSARNYKNYNILIFSLLLFSVGGWAACVAGFLLTDSYNAAITWAKIYYAFPIFIGLFLFLFTYSFPNGTSRTLLNLRSIMVICGALVNLVPLIVIIGYLTEGVAYHSWGKEIVLGRFPYGIYSAYIILTFSSSIVMIYKRIHTLKGVYADQARLLFLSILIASFFGIIFNLILPGIGNYRLIWLGPLFTAFLVLGVTISVVRHKMFDIRLTVARSLGYAASVVALASLYGFIVFGISRYLFHLEISTLAQILLSAATGVAGLVFPYLRKRFDKFTNSLFYRDAYEPQELFDQLNKVLVSSLDTQFLMTQSVSILETALKPDYILIGLKDGESGQRIFGSRKVDFDQKTIMHVRKLTPQVHHKVIVADYIENAKYTELKELMQVNNVAVIVRLSQDVRKNEDGLGYIVLGARKSGNPYTQQDIRVLDTVANELIIAIQNALHFEEIQNFNKTLQTKVDEATRKLKSTNARLRELDESKDDFISMASHQLRTPLTSVKGYLSMVLEGDAGKLTATQTQMLKQSFMSAQRTVYIISDLLNVSRLKTGKFIIDAAPTDLDKVIQEEIDQLKETALSRHVTLIYNRPENFPELMLDETKTRQVIMNFIDNAIYYTPAGGNIEVSLVDKGPSIELRVEDDGIGVPKAEQHHLFTKFYRARNAQRARPDGTGLGLFMAKKVVMSQGGAIIFESKEGVGSTFGFIFSKSQLKAIPTPEPKPKPRAKATAAK